MQRLLVNAVLLALLFFIACEHRPGEKNAASDDSIKNAGYLKATENRYANEIEKNRASFDAYVHRAITRIMLKNYAGALSDCKLAISINPKKCPHFVVGEAKAGLNDYQGAIDAYTNEINAHPTDDLCYSRRADAEQNMKNFDAALKDYAQAILVNPTYGYTYQRKGLLELKMNKKSEACTDLNKALALGVKSAQSLIDANCR